MLGLAVVGGVPVRVDEGTRLAPVRLMPSPPAREEEEDRRVLVEVVDEREPPRDLLGLGVGVGGLPGFGFGFGLGFGLGLGCDSGWCRRAGSRCTCSP